MTEKKTSKKETLVISPPNIQTVEFECYGTAPLVQKHFDKFSQAKIKADHEAGQKAKSKSKKMPRDFDREFELSQHRDVKEGWNGIPATAFKNAMVSACRSAGYVMTKSRQAIMFVHADGWGDTGIPLVRITKGKPKPFLAYVRNKSGVVDLRNRPWFDEWEFTVRVQYDADMLSKEDIANLLMRAGMQVGVGEGRADSKDSNGMGWGYFAIKDK